MLHNWFSLSPCDLVGAGGKEKPSKLPSRLYCLLLCFSVYLNVVSEEKAALTLFFLLRVFSSLFSPDLFLSLSLFFFLLLLFHVLFLVLFLSPPFFLCFSFMCVGDLNELRKLVGNFVFNAATAMEHFFLFMLSYFMFHK